MAIENWQKETRDGIWKAVRADSFFLGLGGTQYDFSGKGLLKKLEIKPAHCPVLAIGPAGGRLMTIGRKAVDTDAYRIAVQVATAVDVGECEAIVLEFCRVLEDYWPALALVRGGRLYEIEVTELDYSLHPSDKEPRPLWSAEFILVCKYRTRS